MSQTVQLTLMLSYGLLLLCTNSLSSRGKRFAIRSLCANSTHFGRENLTLNNIDTAIVCGQACLRHNCQSFVFDQKLRHCSLNDNIFNDEPRICVENVLYGIQADLVDNCVTKGNIRLCNGSNSSSGRVEVLMNGQWGTVCDDSWNEACAQVTCRMFGYTNGSGVSSAYFGPGFGQILMDDTICSGNETSLFDVTYTSTNNCIHQEDSGVNCFDN